MHGCSVKFWFELAESQGKSVSELLGLSKTDYMSENEANWWLARATKVPFLTEQVNISSERYTNWLRKDYLADEDAVEAALKKAQDRLDKEAKEKDNAKKAN